MSGLQTELLVSVTRHTVTSPTRVRHDCVGSIGTDSPQSRGLAVGQTTAPPSRGMILQQAARRDATLTCCTISGLQRLHIGSR